MIKGENMILVRDQIRRTMIVNKRIGLLRGVKTKKRKKRKKEHQDLNQDRGQKKINIKRLLKIIITINLN